MHEDNNHRSTNERTSRKEFPLKLAFIVASAGSKQLTLTLPHNRHTNIHFH
jgi:hypothetical protein